jgi:hypothetical protein
LTLQQNVANLGFRQNVVTRKIPHGNFEKLACMRMVICDNRQFAVPIAAVLTAFLRVFTTPEMGQMIYIYKLAQPHIILNTNFSLQLELSTFQVCNFLKVNIFKNEIKIV